MSRFVDVQAALHQLELGRGQRLRIVARDASENTTESRWNRYWRRWRTRRALHGLSDDLLKDIGLTREQARAEGRRWFWQS